MRFEKGNKKAIGRKPGSKNKKTKIKEALGINNIEDLKEEVLKNWFELVRDTNKQIRLIATKEVSKYLWATKKDINLGLNETELDLLRQAALKQMEGNV